MTRNYRLIPRIIRSGGPWVGLLAVAGSLAVALLESASIAAIIPVIQVVEAHSGSSTIGAKFQQMLAFVGLPMTLPAVLGFAVVAYLLRSVILIGKTWLVAQGKARISQALRHDLARSLFDSQWQFLSSIPVSRATNAIAKEVNRAGNVYWQTFQFLASVITGAFYCATGIIALETDWKVVTAALLCIAVLLVAFRGFVVRAGRIGAAFVELHRELQKQVQEHLWAAKSIKSLGLEATATERLDGISRRFERNDVKSKTNKVAARATIEWAATAMVALLVFVSLEWLKIDVAQAVLIIVILNRLMPIGTQVQQSLVTLNEVLPSAGEAFRLLAMAGENAEPSGKDQIVTLERQLELRNVYFTHVDREHPALTDVSLSLERGKIVAVVGPSGSGKTTLADVVLGLLSPDSGELLVDGVPLTTSLLRAWRRNVSYVPQAPELVSTSLRENIAWGEPDIATGLIVEVLQEIGLGDLLARLPEGLDTPIAEYGGKLSGGERHRITLARALVRRPRLLVLDEPTAAVDRETEDAIWGALRRLRNNAAILIITHRLATLDNADEVVLLKEGRVIARGPWPDVRDMIAPKELEQTAA